ncbi:MAG: ribokinase, partial [bacterium]|nr:ribokinase [bacterium]
MRSSLSNTVLVIGSSNTDLIVQAHHLPAPGETLLGEHFWMAHGGKGANQAVAAVRAGARVHFVARVGKDDFGKQALEAFVREGLDTTRILQDPDLPSGVASILVDATGENCIIVVPGANAALSPVQIDAAAQAFEEASYCLLQLEIPLPTVLHAAELAQQYNLPVILNPAPAQELPDELLDGLFLITPNETEIFTLTGIRPETPELIR